MEEFLVVGEVVVVGGKVFGEGVGGGGDGV